MFDPDTGLRWTEVADAVLESDVIVEPLAVAVCDADRAIIAGKIRLSSPHRFGHEFVGRVVEVGAEVTSFVPGDRVVVPFKISCGRCAPCARGYTSACSTVPLRSAFGFGTELGGDWGGAMTDRVRVPYADHMLVTIPPDVSTTDAAAAGDNLADAHRCVAPGLMEYPGSPVLIMAGGGGAPSIALYSAAIAVALGSEQVDYVDTDQHRLAVAEQLGANPVLASRPPEAQGEYLVTADVSAHPSGRWLESTIRHTHALEAIPARSTKLVLERA